MAEYSNLSATINAQIRANGVQAITGPVLNAVLTAMVNVLGDGYRLNGVAVPADNPGSPDNRVAYLAAQDGTYTNFGGLTISGEVALLLWDSAWTKETLFSIDTAVTPGSGNLVTSGAVDDALTTLAGNIAAAYMQLVPAATEGNLAEFDNAGQVRDAGIATSDVATKDGHYPDLFAGFAGNLVDTRSAGTRQGPFAFRQSGGDGVNYMRRILGRTMAWNQLEAKSTSSPQTINGVTFTPNADGSVTANGTATGGNADFSLPTVSYISGHIYLRKGCPAGGQVGGVNYYAVSNITSTIFAADRGDGAVFTAQASISGNDIIRIYDGVTVNNLKFWPQIIDLTTEGLGLTTADQFRALHPLPYYNYNAGMLKNNAATGLETTCLGANKYDGRIGEADAFLYSNGSTAAGAFNDITPYLPVYPSLNYFLTSESGSSMGNASSLCWYDSNKQYISGVQYSSATKLHLTAPANAAFVRFTTTKANGGHYFGIDTGVEVFEPCVTKTLALGLNSIPCHDENNNAVVVNGLDGVGNVYDEAVVENGYVTKIIKRFAEADLGTLNWALNATFGFVATPSPSPKASFSAICDKYPFVGAYTNIADKTCACIFNTGILVKDTAYSDAPTFKTAMSGVKLRYELATPKVLTVDNPIPALIEVDNLGTEKRLPEDTADNPQGPFESDSNYSVSTANLVRLLNL